MNKLDRYICPILLSLILFSGCVNQNQLDARTEMLEVVLWLTGNPGEKPPYIFEYITIQYSDFEKIEIRYGDCANLDTLKSALTPRLGSVNNLDGKSLDVVPSVATGTLMVYSSGYSFEAQIKTEGNSLILKYAIPGDRGGYTVNPLVGVAPEFISWVLDRAG